MTQTQEPPLAVADRAATESLLRCWVRRPGWSAPDDGVLRLEFPSSGTGVDVPVLYWSPVGWHRFGPARLRSGTPLPATALAALLGTEAADGDTRVRHRPHRAGRRLGAPDRRVRAGQVRRPAGPGRHDGVPRREQALITGHPLHPTPKSREGLTEAEAARYSPEARGAFPLHWFAARPVRRPGRLSSTGRRRTCWRPSRAACRPPAGTVLVPAHPWQAQDVVHRPPVRALLDAGCCATWGPRAPTGRRRPPCGRCTGRTRR